METTVKERLIYFLNYSGISKSEFGRAIGVSSAYVMSIRKSIDNEKIKSITSNYPNLNVMWLLTGNGNMLNNVSDNTSTITAKIKGDGNTQVAGGGNASVGNGGVGAMVSGSKISEQDVNALQDRIRSLEDEILKLKGELKAKDELIIMFLNK